MIDAHCHLNSPQYNNDLSQVLKRAEIKNIDKIFNVGTCLKSSSEAVILADKFKMLYAIIGIHPHECINLPENWIEKLELMAKNKKVIGIGEIGLDYFYKPHDKQLQKSVFIKQLELSFKLKLPLQIHSRKASKDIIEILKSYKNNLLDVPGMFHCMSGDIKYLDDVLDLGFFIGFDGNITYKGLAPGENTPLTDLVNHTPLDRIITETDSPYLTPIPYRGSRNEPSHVIIVGEFIGKIKKTPFNKIETITTKNVNQIFKI